jgi:YaaC-like Protein
VLGGQEDRLSALITAQPDATLIELRDALPTSAALATIWRAINQLDLTLKKTVHADEQRRADVAAQRRQWRDWLPVHDAGHYVFLDECGVIAYFRAGSSAVNFRAGADLPAVGFEFTFDDIARKIPDLLPVYEKWTEKSVPTAVLSSLKFDDTKSELRLTLAGSLTPEAMKVLFPEREGIVPSITIEKATAEVVLPASAPPFFAQRVEGVFDIGDVVVVPPFSSGEYLSPLAVYYAASYVLGMLARYSPSEWVGIGSIIKGDATLPLIRRLLQLIEHVFPELVLMLLQGPHAFDRIRRPRGLTMPRCAAI